MNVISMTYTCDHIQGKRNKIKKTRERIKPCSSHAAMYKLTRSPRWRHSHEKHGERLIDEEILETFIIDGDTEDLSNVAREHDKPILVKEYYRKED